MTIITSESTWAEKIILSIYWWKWWSRDVGRIWSKSGSEKRAAPPETLVLKINSKTIHHKRRAIKNLFNLNCWLFSSESFLTMERVPHVLNIRFLTLTLWRENAFYSVRCIVGRFCCWNGIKKRVKLNSQKFQCYPFIALSEKERMIQMGEIITLLQSGLMACSIIQNSNHYSRKQIRNVRWIIETMMKSHDIASGWCC